MGVAGHGACTPRQFQSAQGAHRSFGRIKQPATEGGARIRARGVQPRQTKVAAGLRPGGRVCASGEGLRVRDLGVLSQRITQRRTVLYRELVKLKYAAELIRSPRVQDKWGRHWGAASQRSVIRVALRPALLIRRSASPEFSMKESLLRSAVKLATKSACCRFKPSDGNGRSSIDSAIDGYGAEYHAPSWPALQRTRGHKGT